MNYLIFFDVEYVEDKYLNLFEIQNVLKYILFPNTFVTFIVLQVNFISIFTK